LGVVLQKKQDERCPNQEAGQKIALQGLITREGGQLQKAFKGRSQVYRMKFWLRLGPHF